jgi:hypothetical protein
MLPEVRRSQNANPGCPPSHRRPPSRYQKGTVICLQEPTSLFASTLKTFQAKLCRGKRTDSDRR